MKNVRDLTTTQAHAVRIEEIQALLEKLAVKVNQEAKEANPDWGHVGSLGHVLEQLEEIDQFLGN